jgi:DnaK suppressor protein
VEAKKLREYRRELEEIRNRLAEEIDHIVDATRDEYQVPGEHDARPSQTVDRQVYLEQNEEALHEAVRAALARIEAGTFGDCESCGQPISSERLSAIPYAVFCVKCQARHEAQQAPAGQES